MNGSELKRVLFGPIAALAPHLKQAEFWEARTATGQGPMHLAAKADDADAWPRLQALLDAGGATDVRDHEQRTPLMLAFERPRDWAQWHPLIAASRRTVPWVDAAGRSALHRAVQARAAGAVPALLAAGADPMERDRQGIRPLDVARAIRDPEGADAYLVRCITRAARDPGTNWCPTANVIRERLRHLEQRRDRGSWSR